jgi:hypothetical protein
MIKEEGKNQEHRKGRERLRRRNGHNKRIILRTMGEEETDI